MPSALGPDQVGGFASTVRITVRHQDVRALAGEQQRDSAAVTHSGAARLPAAYDYGRPASQPARSLAQRCAPRDPRPPENRGHSGHVGGWNGCHPLDYIMFRRGTEGFPDPNLVPGPSTGEPIMLRRAHLLQRAARRAPRGALVRGVRWMAVVSTGSPRRHAPRLHPAATLYRAD
jgi:hypothetical protein